MMKKISILALLVVLVTSISCKKDNNEDPVVDNSYQSKGYIPLKVGSYWIYQHYKETSNGTDSAIAMIDSTYISSTKTINNQIYYVSGKNNLPIYDLLVRDSVGYLVDTVNNIFMSENNFSDTIYSKDNILANGTILYHISLKMYDNNDQITVPAGSFSNCIEGRSKIKLYFQSAADPKEYYDHAYYAKDVGLIQSSYRYSSQATIYKKKLIRYYIPN